MPIELPIPPKARDAEDGREILRVFLGNGTRVYMVCPVGEVAPVEAWGIVLADVLRTIAKAHAAVGFSEQQVLNDIARMFNDEVGDPSSPTRVYKIGD